MSMLAVNWWIAGSPVTLDALRGKTVVLGLWHSTEDSAEPFLAALKQIAAKYRKQNVEVVTVRRAVGDTATVRRNVQQFAAKHGAGLRVALDAPPAQGGRGATFEQYKVERAPSVFLIDADGKICYQDLALEAVSKALDTLLAAK